MATPEEKLDNEVEKLELEIVRLKQSSWRSPAGMTAFVAIAVALIQWGNSKRELQLAEIKVREANIELKELAEKKETFEDDIADLEQRQEDVQREEAQLSAKVIALRKFINDNPSLEGANALIDKLRLAQFPISVSRTFNSDKLKTITEVELTKDGKLSLKIAMRGFAKKIPRQDYSVVLNKLTAKEQIASFDTGPITVKGESKLLVTIKFDKTFIFKIPPETMNQIHLSSQIKIIPTAAKSK